MCGAHVRNAEHVCVRGEAAVWRRWSPHWKTGCTPRKMGKSPKSTGQQSWKWKQKDKTWSQSKFNIWGFPGGAVVENLPANAEDTGSSPGPGRSHMPRSNWAREPQLLSLRVWSLCSATREAAIVRGPHTAMKRGPRSPQLEKARTETKTQHSWN